ncbi:glycosyltransferase [Pararhodobacter sp. SW119]|uniref:glycosyltransferase n=1 Tax=Pararhodobacter sp. SW119 TaxID=2780075 RepID=UPI001FD79A0C|nr:glycosyltransferase [Pararhodobacter sp. SW119]
MPATPPRISIVIPHLNQPAMLARCLDALAVGSEAPDEVVVVDNGSDELPRAICEAAGARLLQEAEPGPGPARNRGIAVTTGEILAFIDADCLADPGWIAAIRAAFADPSAEILGGDVRIARANPARVSMIEAYESVYAYRMDRYIAEQGFTGTGNLAVRRRVLDAVGPFGGLDVAEDRDWGQRATRAGHALRYVPEMRVYHPARQSFAELALKWDRHIAHDFEAAHLRPGGRLRFVLKTAAMGLSPLVELPRVLRSDRLSGPRARALAWVGLWRIRLYRMRVMARLLVTGDAEALTGRWNRG